MISHSPIVPPSAPDVPYVSARASIQTGDYLFCAGDSSFSNLIQRFTGSWASHAGKIVCALGRVMVAEAVESVGTRLHPLSRYVRTYEGELFIARHEAWHTMADNGALARFILDNQGERYDPSEIARIAARIAGFGSHEPNTEDDAWICSEYVAEADRVAGIVGVPRDDRGFVSPRDLVEWNDVEIMCRLTL